MSANRLLAAVPEDGRGRLLAVARQVASSSGAWLRKYPVVKRPSVTDACSLVSAVAMPGLALRELDILTRWWLWIFGLDDVLDDLLLPEEQVAAWVDHFLRVLPAGAEDGDLLRAAFGSIHHELRRYALYRPLGARWRAGMVDIVRGMLHERRWSAATPAEQPGYRAYLHNASVTIAVLPYTLTAAILVDEAQAVDHLSSLDPLIHAAARCFRLANDLRSDVRERAEGKLNAVSLLQREYTAGGLGDEAAARAARERLRRTCAADLAYLDSARRSAGPALATLARFLWAHTAFVWNMYQFGDYDTLSSVLRQEANA